MVDAQLTSIDRQQPHAVPLHRNPIRAGDIPKPNNGIVECLDLSLLFMSPERTFSEQRIEIYNFSNQRQPIF